jgi:hypothetical protein
MILISHRGNLNGKMESLENDPTYIDIAILKGYDVEIDVWFKDGILYLGHDNPQYEVNFKWFMDRINNLWVHCKNLDAILYFKNLELKFNYFWHQEDDITLTSLNYIWAYPGKQPIKESIAVLPEIHNDDISQSLGICSDIIENYKKK